MKKVARRKGSIPEKARSSSKAALAVFPNYAQVSLGSVLLPASSVSACESHRSTESKTLRVGQQVGFMFQFAVGKFSSGVRDP